MSEPLLFIDPEDGAVCQVTQYSKVTLEEIDEKIKSTQERLDHLNAIRSKYLALSEDNATPEEPAQPSEPTQPEQPAPVEPVQTTDPVQPEAPVQPTPSPTPEEVAATAAQENTPPISA